jgi:hypothetical protein
MHAAPRAAESAAHDADRSPRAALIAQVLDSLRFHGWFFCVSELSAPWALQLPGGRLAAIHAVLEGECVVTLASNGTTLHLSAGDVVVLPRDEVHAMSDRAGRPIVAVTAIAGIDRRDRRASSLSYGGGGALTRLLTASFTAEMRSAQAIVAGLPAIMVLRAATPECKRLSPAGWLPPPIHGWPPRSWPCTSSLSVAGHWSNWPTARICHVLRSSSASRPAWVRRRRSTCKGGACNWQRRGCAKPRTA